MGYRLIGPNDDKDFAFDYTDFLDEVGSPDDSIQTSTWRIVPDEGSPGAEIHDTSFEAVDGVHTTRAFIRGCTRGRVYLMLNEITTAVGRTCEKSITLVCEGES